MSEATTKALTDLIYDRWGESGTGHELDNEQLYTLAREAAQTIESAGTTKAIIRAWLDEQDLTTDRLLKLSHKAQGSGLLLTAEALEAYAWAIREVSS